MYIDIAKAEDLRIITEIHIKCWAEVYSFIPKEVHQLRTFEYRFQQWKAVLENPAYGSMLFVLRDTDKVVGFCYCTRNKDKDIQASSELHAAYILPEWRGGVSGPLMMQAMVRHLLNLHLTPICLWAFDENPIQRWYRMMGWKKVVSRNRNIAGYGIPEGGFICQNPNKLLKRLNSIIDAKTVQPETRQYY